VTATAADRPVGRLTRPSMASRLLGLGSVFGKTVRDGRRTALVIGGLFTLVLVVTASQVAIEFDTLAERQAFAAQMTALPAIFQGMLGEPLAIETLGGFLSWRVINFMPVMLGIWAVVALSGTLAGELARGSLDVLAAGPISRSRIAVEKVLGYLAAQLLAIGLFAIGLGASLAAFAILPGDDVGIGPVLAHSAWLYLATLLPGALAFAVAPVLGRGGARAVGAVTLFASFVVNAYASTIPALESVRGLSYFALTAGHRPIAGAWDWPAVAALAGVIALLMVAGVLAFVRRDLVVSAGGRIRVPTLPLWLMGPFTRSLGERLPAALAWGALLAVFGAVIASAVDEFVETIGRVPQIVAMIERFMPDADILSVGGFLQLAFFQQGIVILGIAASVLVAGWASDEGDRRLELLLSAPLTRMAWAIRSAVAVLVGVGILTALLALGVAAGASTQAASGDLTRPVLGVSVLGLYGMALAGVGLAVGGLVRPSLAAPVTLVLGLAFFLLDLIGSILRLPDEVLDIALNRHLGKPMLGEYDWPGMAVCAGLAIGGVLVCAIGMRRRDIGR
jgi:ABC-2 type transport system permease protein